MGVSIRVGKGGLLESGALQIYSAGHWGPDPNTKRATVSVSMLRILHTPGQLHPSFTLHKGRTPNKFGTDVEFGRCSGFSA